MPENHSVYQGRLTNLRKEMMENDVSGYILPRTDEFQGEFLAGYAERLAWLTGFTGSAGLAVVLQNSAVVMSDGRYTIQLRNQVNLDLYNIENSIELSIGEWISLHTPAGSRIGYDVWLHTPKQIKTIEDEIEGKDITLVPLSHNLIDAVWQDQPAKPSAPVIIFPDGIAGRISAEKRADIAHAIRSQDCVAGLLTVGDSICWLLNVRGGDIDYSPLMLSYALIYADASVDWFIQPDKVTEDVQHALGTDIRVFDMDAMTTRLRGVQGQVCLDRSSAPIWFESIFADTLHYRDPCTAPKAIKTETEQNSIRMAHIHDGVAVTRFLHWLQGAALNEALTELSIEEKLEAFRRMNTAYKQPSFSTIAGFAGNGAIVHYRATQETDAPINCNGLLLVDSGGQYEWGTTDITRTISIGTPTREMQENYTRVLKGHIAVAAARFQRGTIGKDIDSLARKSLQEVGLDYAHGTGHGVGCYLCVHEAAANISPRGEVAFEAGMLISNEPGYYKEGAYGIRIENLVLVQEDKEGLCFETVTFAPFDAGLILRDMLDDVELRWLDTYFTEMCKVLLPHLSEAEGQWLTAQWAVGR